MVNQPEWRKLSWGDRLAWFIGSGFGMGFMPVAPGTAGSAAAAVIYVAIMLLLLPGGWGQLERLLLTAALATSGFPIGVWATGRMATPENPDPGAAVWDEFVGMWITLIPIPQLLLLNWDVRDELWAELLLAAIAFVAFRAMDILKPWPCRRLERLPGGWGIMLDDVAAGIWAKLLLLPLGAAIIFALEFLFWLLSPGDFLIGGCY